MSKTNELEKEAQKEPEEIADAEPEVVEEKKTRKKATKKTRTRKKDEQLKFPVEGFVNKYGFVKVRGPVLEKLGWKITGPRLALVFDVQDGVLTVKKKNA